MLKDDYVSHIELVYRLFEISFLLASVMFLQNNLYQLKQHLNQVKVNDTLDHNSFPFYRGIFMPDSIDLPHLVLGVGHLSYYSSKEPHQASVSVFGDYTSADVQDLQGGVVVKGHMVS